MKIVKSLPPSVEAPGADTPAMWLFALLEVIAAKDQRYSLQGLVEETGLPKPTLHRMLQQMEGAGLLQREGDGRHYGMGTRLRRLAGRRWTKDGALVIQCDETRSQARNREIARERLVELIRAALVKPKRRIATKPTYGSQKRRLKAKKVRGDVKAMRGKVQGEE